MLDAAEPHTVCPFSLRRVFLARSGKPTLKYEISACGALNFTVATPLIGTRAHRSYMAYTAVCAFGSLGSELPFATACKNGT